MGAKFIHWNRSSLARRPMLAAILIYWIVLGVAALILTFTAHRGAVGYRPYLAAVAPSALSATAICVV
jgi:hypothetical protein